MNKDAEYLKAITQIIKTGHWMTHQASLKLKSFEISEPQFNVLRILRGRKGKPATVSEIQKDMVQQNSNVTRIIDKLLLKSLVERKECIENRRKMDITITEQGLKLLTLLDQKLLELHEPLMQNITASEAKTLSSLIIKLKGK